MLLLVWTLLLRRDLSILLQLVDPPWHLALFWSSISCSLRFCQSMRYFFTSSGRDFQSSILMNLGQFCTILLLALIQASLNSIAASSSSSAYLYNKERPWEESAVLSLRILSPSLESMMFIIAFYSSVSPRRYTPSSYQTVTLSQRQNKYLCLF